MSLALAGVSLDTARDLEALPPHSAHSGGELEALQMTR
eukprot:gene3899-23433_t